MYVTQLAAIRDGIEPRIDPGMSMVWANGPRTGWESAGFFHDAGQQAEDGAHFCKISHQASPWGKPLAVSPDSASAPYVDLIRRTAEEHPRTRVVTPRTPTPAQPTGWAGALLHFRIACASDPYDPWRMCGKPTWAARSSWCASSH